MKNYNLLFCITLAVIVNSLSAQTLIDHSVTLYSNGTSNRLFTTNKIYFKSTSGDIKVLDSSENITTIPNLSSYTIQFEFNGLIYLWSLVEEKISTISLINHSVSTFFTNPNDIIFISRGLVQLNGEFYFVGWENNEYRLYELDSNGIVVNSYTFPGPVQNTNRIHVFSSKVYFQTNTISPSQTYYYEYDPIVGTIVGISSSDYNATLGNLPNYQSFEVNGETFTIASSGQLTSDLNPVDLTCFDNANSGEGIFAPILLGPIGSNLYLSYDSQGFGGSINGIYRYPEYANEGLCEPMCDQDIQPQVKVNDGDVYLEEPCRGVIFTTNNGDCYRMTVTISGDLETTLITCLN